MWLSINRLPIITTVFLRINSHNDIDGIDDPGHVTQNSQQQTDAELQLQDKGEGNKGGKGQLSKSQQNKMKRFQESSYAAATMPQKNPQRRKQDCNQDLKADGTPL